MNGFSQGTPQLTNAGTAGVIPIQSEKNGYCYYSEEADGTGNLYSFDGDLIGPPSTEELEWIKTRQYKEKL